MGDYEYNDGRYPTASFLLGLGPMPPLQGTDYAVANMNRALDSGYFDPAQGWYGPYGQQPEFAQNHSQGRAQPHVPTGVLNLDVHIPCRSSDRASKNDLIVTKILTFDINGTIPTDFLDRVCATMGKTRDVAELGWKTCDAKKRDAPNMLRDADDVKTAWKAHEGLLKSTRRLRPVYMEIFDMAKAPSEEPTKALPKTYETAYSDELKIVKEKLQCATHKGPNRWCYISPVDGDGGKHIELGFEEISLWARLMHNDPQVDKNCAVPPNTLNLDRLLARTQDRRQRKEKANPTTEVHVHQHYGGQEASAKRGHDEVAGNHDSDSDSDDEPSAIPIRTVLADLDKKMPDLEILQYEDALRGKKIVYAQTVADFERDYYVKTIGMADGAVGSFLKHARKLVGKQRKDRKRAKLNTDKENEPIPN
ncbi:hypothetical protein C8J57DRAFT_1331706 [Mycena rebaudengoi]|nr:hypothetical protein C8J57DRAFT_1331706 [Mycena rebaudengoi]